MPTDINTSPPSPFVASPVYISIDPLLPLLDVPDVNDNLPLTPFVPLSFVLTINAPLDVYVPTPVLNDIIPPV